jgi:hypothetical protein
MKYTATANGWDKIFSGELKRARQALRQTALLIKRNRNSHAKKAISVDFPVNCQTHLTNRQSGADFMTVSPSRPLVFGIYPGGPVGAETGLLQGPPDDPSKIHPLLDELQGTSPLFVIRCYDSFQDPGSPLFSIASAPLNYAQYARKDIRPLDLVLQFRSASGDVPGYLDFVRSSITEHHQHLYSVQITEEPNFTNGPNIIDGPYPNVYRAVTEGVVTAKETLRSLGFAHVKVGFNATPTFGSAEAFWPSLKALDIPRFFESLDYVGLDFFPDVFRPVAPLGNPGDLASSVTGILETMRHSWLPAAGIADHSPIHITEHGWPTGPNRSRLQQAETLDTVIHLVHALSGRLNIDRYTLFDLRDVAHPDPEGNSHLFTFFGITDADYQPKPAYSVVRNLIQQIGVR